MEYLLYLGALALIAVGLAGTVIPAIPGLPIIFAGSWLIGWASGYELISVTAVVILALLAAVGIGIDILAQILGAKRAGATCRRCSSIARALNSNGAFRRRAAATRWRRTAPPPTASRANAR